MRWQEPALSLLLVACVGRPGGGGPDDDGEIASGGRDIQITDTDVGGPNDLPTSSSLTADTLALRTDEDVALPFVVSGSEEGGGPVTFRLVEQPSRGTLTGSLPAVVYTPDPDLHGEDVLAFRVEADGAASRTALVTITVASVPDAPVANRLELSGPAGSPIVVTPEGTDADGDSLSFVVVTQPSRGSLTRLGSGWTYTPAGTTPSVDTFTYAASDGMLTSPPAQVTLRLERSNTPPVAQPLAVTTREDSPVVIEPVATDPDGDAVQLEVAQAPSRGQLLPSGAGWLYVPDEDVHGVDQFTYRATDGVLHSPPTQVDVTVTPVNDPPVPTASDASGIEDQPIQWSLVASDIDGDPLTFVITRGPDHGTATLAGDTLTYQPHPNTFGTDTLAWAVSDGTVTTNPVQATITVAAVPDPPTVADLDVEVDEDQVLVVQIPSTDPDGDSLTHAVVDAPVLGGATIVGDTLTYTPRPDLHGIDTIDVAAFDGTAWSTAGRITVTVHPVADAPEPTTPPATMDEDTSTSIRLTGTDADGDAVSFSLGAQPAHGVATLLGDQLTYTPARNFFGTERVPYVVSDGALSTPGEVVVTVRNVDDPPVDTLLAFRGLGNVALQIDAADGIASAPIDPDGDPLTIPTSTISTTQGGEVDVAADGSLLYRPPVGAHTVLDVAQVVVSDPGGRSATVTIRFSVGRRVWIVDNTGPANGVGTTWRPFSTLAAAIDVSEANDVLAISAGDGTNRGLRTEARLQSGQWLVGTATEVVVDGVHALPAAGRPIIGGHGGEAVRVEANGRVSGLEIADVGGVGISVRSVDGRVDDVWLTRVGGDGIFAQDADRLVVEDVTITDGRSDAVFVKNSVDVSVARLGVAGCDGHGIALDAVAGAVSISDTTVRRATGDGVRIESTLLGTGDRVLLERVYVEGTGTDWSTTGWGVVAELDGASDGTSSLELIDVRGHGLRSGGVFVTVLGNLGAGTGGFDLRSTRTQLDLLDGPGILVVADDNTVVDALFTDDTVDILPGSLSGAPEVSLGDHHGADDAGEVAIAASAGNDAPEAIDLETTGNGVMRARVVRPSVSGAMQGIELSQWGGGHLAVTVTDALVEAARTGFSSRCHDDGTLAFRVQTATVDANTSLHAAAPDGFLDLDVAGIAGTGAFRIDGLIDPPPTLRLAHPLGPQGASQQSDAGALYTAGNTTLGAPPIVLVDGWIDVVTPADVVTP